MAKKKKAGAVVEEPERGIFDVLRPVTIDGVRYRRAERVALSRQQAEALGGRFVLPVGGAFRPVQNRALTDVETR